MLSHTLFPMEELQQLLRITNYKESTKTPVGVCCDLLVPVLIDLSVENDPRKVRLLENKIKETQNKIKELQEKARCSLDLSIKHLNIEKERCSKIELLLLCSSLKNATISELTKIIPLDILVGLDHSKYAIITTHKQIVKLHGWILFLSALANMAEKLNTNGENDQVKVLPPNNSMIEKYSEVIIVDAEDEGHAGNETSGSVKTHQLFKEGAYDLFVYLDNEYTVDNSSPVAKYSYIYRFLAYEQLIGRSIKAYMEFIKETEGVQMSKVLPEGNKYADIIHPLLCRLKSAFEQRKRKERLKK